jgi:hypothetical protein
MKSSFLAEQKFCVIKSKCVLMYIYSINGQPRERRKAGADPYSIKASEASKKGPENGQKNYSRN